MSFTDMQVLVPQIHRERPLPAERLTAAIGIVDPRRSLAAQRAYLAAYFGLHPRGQPTPLFDADAHTSSPDHPTSS